jgi:hypothetical protein
MYRSARGAFSGFGEAVAFLENEIAASAICWDHLKMLAGCAQGTLEMLEMVADIFLRYLYYLRKVFSGIRPFFKHSREVMPNSLISLGRLL